MKDREFRFGGVNEGACYWAVPISGAPQERDAGGRVQRRSVAQLDGEVRKAEGARRAGRSRSEGFTGGWKIRHRQRRRRRSDKVTKARFARERREASQARPAAWRGPVAPAGSARRSALATERGGGGTSTSRSCRQSSTHTRVCIGEADRAPSKARRGEGLGRRGQGLVGALWTAPAGWACQPDRRVVTGSASRPSRPALGRTSRRPRGDVRV